ncbi:TetR/AcrR family transcriptional regulator [Mycobacterium sp. MYCO198283]|uniref:TetR/AcrR family transcriptional regulator n=1 Tax=Mycobacterium sp. MYCO198283 TaxID=2883505 RepID=UPI001E592176|nr:TetR/AcrR family transcriptional regulator [Mycobacterium sp. MYCO198283]MCG5433164.1 TetR/AcrR family transcriptional regulator [Mycobacterium sp. MYCO198283]
MRSGSDGSRIAAAVQRALDDRQRDATEEVERILAAAVEVMQETAPAPPRVSDIITRARTSNTAFYRYFSGKDELMLAVMERGVAMVASYLAHEMGKEPTARDRIARWITGMLAQVGEARLTAATRAVVSQLSSMADEEIADPLRQLLLAPITETGCATPHIAADAVFATVVGVLRRHIALATQPTPAEADYLVGYCLRGLGTAG